jgi:hypothetical protein
LRLLDGYLRITSKTSPLVSCAQTDRLSGFDSISDCAISFRVSVHAIVAGDLRFSRLTVEGGRDSWIMMVVVDMVFLASSFCVREKL